MKTDAINSIRECLDKRILILDGAMGTRLQTMGLTPDMFHRGRFADWPVRLVGNHEVLNLTAPEVIRTVHELYIEAGADIITTNTFSANRISQHEYGCDLLAAELARSGAAIARQAADACDRQIWVAGSMGPTSKSLSVASDMNDPLARAASFDEMAAAYCEQARGLLEGGADLLLLETCIDALNTKAALYAIQQLNDELGEVIPVMVSATINDRSGRLLTGQTLEAFFTSVSHYPLLSFGINCSFGVTELRPFVEQLSESVPVFLSIHPNAGLPNEMGEYEELPAFTASHLRAMAEAGLLNIAGGCCGTDERHIRAISEALKGLKPRQVPASDCRLIVSGLDSVSIDSSTQLLTNVGERTNVAGSRKFARLISQHQYEEAATIARQQISGGASIIDINMDDAMLDSRQEMEAFVRYIESDPAIARSALMIDSSDWSTVLAGLKNAQGKCIVNSISLKNGEEDFLGKARQLHHLGAAVVVMAFDEEGQATTFDRKTAIAQRAYHLLTNSGFPARDIIFDLNILTVATGIAEHARYAVDFIEGVRWVKEHLPGAKTSGGVSNLSFAFRGNNAVREAMHSVFLYHAVRAGLDMAIVNPSMLQVYDDIRPDLLRAVEDVILNRDEGATERLTTLAETLKAESSEQQASPDNTTESWRQLSVAQRLSYALSKCVTDWLDADLQEAITVYGSAVQVIEQPLMQAMEHVGTLFGAGKMFLPQVVKTAKVMKEAVALLQPYMDHDETTDDQRPSVLMATANGDVHDIGKNIVDIVLSCNNFRVADLGVMVPCETILQETLSLQPLAVGLSGLITPSLKEMERLCRLFQEHHLHVPIIVGGATTSAVHTAVRLAPLYDGGVIYGGDASQTSVLVKHLQMDKEATLAAIQAEQRELRTAYQESHQPVVAYEDANRRAPRLTHACSQPKLTTMDEHTLIPLDEVASLIDWRMFLLFWGFKGETLQQLLVNPEAERTLNEGKEYLREALRQNRLKVNAIVCFEPATRQGNDIVLANGTILPMLRSQSTTGSFLCLADYFDERQSSPLGLFTVVARPDQQPGDEAERLMVHALCARLTEAATEWMQQRIYGAQSALRVAFGYATCPDHSLKRIVFDRLDAERRLALTLTDHYSILPSTAICGLFLSHPEAHYFPVGRIDKSQLSDYCRRRSISMAEGEQLLSKYIV